MGRREGFGEFIRRQRRVKGLGSARNLARLAGLSHSHVATAERGAFRPRWGNAERIMSALSLSEKEREEFIRLWDEAGKPPAVRRATKGLIIPGLAVWKHLPERLFALPHGETGLLPAAADRILPDLVTAGAALLGYRAAALQRPDAAILDALRAAVDELADCEPTAISPPEYTAPRAISARLVDRWHALIFATPRAVQRAIRPIARWTYGTSLSPLSDARLSFSFRAGEATVLPREAVRAAWIERAYNAFTLETLWTLLALPSRFDCPADFSFYYTPDFKVTLRQLEELDLASLPARLSLPSRSRTPARVTEYLFHCEHAFALQHDGAFLARLRAGPTFAETCIGPDWAVRLNRAATVVAELAKVLSTATQRAAPGSAPEPPAAKKRPAKSKKP